MADTMPVESVPPEERAGQIAERLDATLANTMVADPVGLCSDIAWLLAERDALNTALAEGREAVGGIVGAAEAWFQQWERAVRDDDGDAAWQKIEAKIVRARAFLSSCPVPTPKPKDGEE